jgi:hypothetical protein
LVGVNGGGFGLSVGKSSSGLPMVLCSMQNFSGNSPMTGWTFLATGLYFFLAVRKRSIYGARWSEGEVVESARVWTVLYKVDDGVSGKSHADNKCGREWMSLGMV